MTKLDAIVERASGLNALETRLRASLQEAERVLTFAIEDGFLADEDVMALCIDPYGMLADIRAALAHAAEIEAGRKG